MCVREGLIIRKCMCKYYFTFAFGRIYKKNYIKTHETHIYSIKCNFFTEFETLFLFI